MYWIIFKIDDETLIIKKYDYIPAEYISLIVTDEGESSPNYLYKIFDKYYEWCVCIKYIYVCLYCVKFNIIKIL